MSVVAHDYNDFYILSRLLCASNVFILHSIPRCFEYADTRLDAPAAPPDKVSFFITMARLDC